MRRYLCNQEHKFHSYVINIHIFGPKPVCVLHLFGSVIGIRVYVLCVVEFESIVESLVEKREQKERKEQIIRSIIKQEMWGDLFILESWIDLTTWVEVIQLVAMEIMRGKPS